MKMSGIKDEFWFIAVLFLASLLESESVLYVSHTMSTRFLNETFLVICKDTVNNSTPVKWSGPNGPLANNTRPSVTMASFGTYIVFNRTKSSDSGTYVCTDGKNRAEFRLVVDSPIRFKNTPLIQTGTENTDAVIRCEVEEGQITSWTINGNELSDKKRMKPIGDGLLIRNTNRSDTNIYTCTAVKEKSGATDTASIRFVVHHKPSYPHPVYAKQGQAYGFVGGTVNLTCNIHAEPPPTFEWYRGRERKKLHKGIIKLDNHTSILQLRVDAKTFGNYRCRAYNYLGEIDTHFSLEQGTQPDPPDFVKFLGANADRIELGIYGPDLSNRTVPVDMNTTGYVVEYRPKDAEDHFSSQDFNVTEDNEYSLKDLFHDTEYEIRVATRNLAGLSDFTNSSFFKTIPSQSDSVHLNSPSFYIAVNFVVVILTTYVLSW